MSEQNNNGGIIREVPTQTVEVKTIKLMDGGGLPQPTETTANTVGDLRKDRENGGLGLSGSKIVNDVVADDSTPILQTDPLMRVSHMVGGKRGGAPKKTLAKSPRKVKVETIGSSDDMRKQMRSLLGRTLACTETADGGLDVDVTRLAVSMYDKQLKHLKLDLDVHKTNVRIAKMQKEELDILRSKNTLKLS